MEVEAFPGFPNIIANTASRNHSVTETWSTLQNLMINSKEKACQIAGIIV
jgi:hypothetical protein